jgi:hypothetical protein
MHVMLRYRAALFAVLLGTLLLTPTPGQASHEAFGIYEDWSQPTIRSDRWRGVEDFGGQEVKREVQGDTLQMRFRLEGGTFSDTGAFFADNFLLVTNPLSVDQLEAEFQVKALTVTGCSANPTASRARAARLLITRFNDGTSTGPGDRTGDHFGLIVARRDSNATEDPGILQVAGAVVRCINPGCTATTDVASIVLPETVQVGEPFTLRLIWDQPMRRFLLGVGTDPGVPLNYASSDTDPAVLPFAGVQIAHTAANCRAGPTVVDAEIEVGVVQTNMSAIIP